MRYLITVMFLCGLLHLCPGQQIDSLKMELEKRQALDRVPVLHELIINLWLNYPEQALDFGEEALKLSLEHQDSVNISKSLRLKAGVFYYKGDYDQSLDLNDQALVIAQRLGDLSLINNGYNNIGLLYMEIGSYQIALEYLLKSIQLKEEIDEIYGLATTLNNIGRIFDRIGAFDEAREYFEKALDASYKSGDRVEIYSLNNIGLTYLKEGNVPLAKEYFTQALKLGEKYGNIFWGALAMRGMAGVYIRQNKLDSAKYFAELSLEESRRIDDAKGISESLYALSKYNLTSKDYVSALTYLDQSHVIAKRLGLREQLLDNLELYTRIYRALNNPRMETKYQARYITLTDSLFKDVTARNLTLVPLKLKEEADRETMASQEVEIQKQSYKNQLYVVILIISVPGVVVLIFLLQKNKKAHEDVLRTQKLLITSEKMASLGIMAAGIAHEINNPLNYIKQGAAALVYNTEDSSDPQCKENLHLLKIIDEGVDRASNIVMSLSHFSRQTTDMNESCDITDIIENCLLILQNRFQDKVTVVKHYETKNKLQGNEGRLHQAIMNILSNAEQAISKKGKITIKVASQGENIQVVIEDDGKGIPKEQLDKIGDPFFTTKSPGQGTGLGLFITYAIIEEHRGHFEVQSETGKGTTFSFTLPLRQNQESRTP